MAGPLDPFTPGVGGMPVVDPNTFAQIRSEWDAFMGDPRGRAALLSTGLAMMQPPSFGDTFTSQLGRAIGAGGESIRATEALDLKQQEAESKDEARQAQSEARMMNAETRAASAEARAGIAGAKMDTAGARLQLAQQALELKQQQLAQQGVTSEERLKLQREALELKRQVAEAQAEAQRERITGQQRNNQLNNRVKLLIGHRKAADQAALLGQPAPSYEDWLRSTGLSEDDETIPSVSPPTTSGARPQAMPSNKAELKPNVLYQTPRGVLKWTGTGFVQP